jgi:hypothetical protein
MITKGNWGLREINGGHFIIKVDGIRIGQIRSECTEDDAQIICDAINACQEVNPNNPLIVAQNIGKMVEALKVMVENCTMMSDDVPYRKQAIEVLKEIGIKEF